MVILLLHSLTMFGISFGELLLVFSIILLIFGPKKLPELASSLGAFLFTVRKQSDSLRREFYNSVYTPFKEIESDRSSKED